MKRLVSAWTVITGLKPGVNEKIQRPVCWLAKAKVIMRYVVRMFHSHKYLPD